MAHDPASDVEITLKLDPTTAARLGTLARARKAS